MSTLEITETKQYVVIEQDDTQQTVEIVEQSLGVIEIGIQGPQGIPGNVLSADKNYETPLTGQTSLTVTHNLGKYPAITVFDSAGDEVEGEYRHLSNNSTVLSFSAGFSGKAIFN